MNENRKPKLSVVIPVYQAEASLAECLDDLLAQTFKDFEIILVNDGSRDRSPEICEKYAADYSFIHVFHQENQGPSKARNEGLKRINGEFVTFIDADDRIGPLYLQHFFEMEASPKQAIVFQGYTKHFPDGTIEKTAEGPKTYPKDKFNELFLETNPIRRYPYTHGKMYDAAVIKQHQLSFETHLDVGEDLKFLLDGLFFVQKVIFVPASDYHYILHGASISSGRRLNLRHLELLQEALPQLKATFNFSTETVALVHNELVRIMMRILKGYYIPPLPVAYPERRQVLKTLVEQGYFSLLKVVHSRRLFYRLISRLSLWRWYWALDELLKAQFKKKHYRNNAVS